MDHPQLRRLLRPYPPAASAHPGGGHRLARATQGVLEDRHRHLLGVPVIAMVPLVAVVAYVVIKGLPAWNADFFTHAHHAGGDPRRRRVERHRRHRGDRGHRHGGGRAPRAARAGCSWPSRRAGRRAIRFTADVMTGVPSITIGIFGYIAIVKNTGHYSGLAGAFAIGIIMLPVIIRAGETAFRGCPPPQRGGPGPRGPAGRRSPAGSWCRPLCPG